MRENTFRLDGSRTTAKVSTFDSIQDLTNWLDSAKITPMFASRTGGATSMREGGENWSGTNTWDEARRLMKSGWAEKAKELESQLSKELNKEPTQVMRQKSVYDVVGGNCSVPRYLQGVPTSMVRQVRTPVKQKTVTVNYNLTFNCNTRADYMIEKAVKCLAYVKKLEDLGTRVNLNVFFVTESFSSHNSFAYVVPIKKTGERLSLAKMAFTLCHPAMFRRIMFGCLERDIDVTEDFVYGYGRAVRDESTLSRIFPNTTFFN